MSMLRRLLGRLLLPLVPLAFSGAAGRALGAGGPAPVVTVENLTAHTFDAGGGHVLPYRLFVPAGAAASAKDAAAPAKGAAAPAKKFPLVLFLHGAGGRGTDNRGQIADQTSALVFVQPGNQAKWPVFMVAPQCPSDQQWVAMAWGEAGGKGKRPAAPTWPLAAAVALVDKLAAEYPSIDTTRVYVTGLSMGGYGTFDAAARWPQKWKAAVPVCGGYDETQVDPLVNVPLWAFHAEDDPVVPVGRTRAVIDALKARGGKPKYTEYPAAAKHGHFSWIPAYKDPRLLPWMFGDPAPARR